MSGSSKKEINDQYTEILQQCEKAFYKYIKEANIQCDICPDSPECIKDLCEETLCCLTKFRLIVQLTKRTLNDQVAKKEKINIIEVAEKLKEIELMIKATEEMGLQICKMSHINFK